MALLMLAFFGALAVAYVLLERSRFKGLFLTDELHGTAIESPEKLISLGQEGRATTRLNPMGRAEFNGNEIEVTSRDGLIEAGTPIKVVRLEQGRVTVKSIINQ